MEFSQYLLESAIFSAQLEEEEEEEEEFSSKKMMRKTP
jgi:hypothetical protein